MNTREIGAAAGFYPVDKAFHDFFRASDISPTAAAVGLRSLTELLRNQNPTLLIMPVLTI